MDLSSERALDLLSALDSESRLILLMKLVADGDVPYSDARDAFLSTGGREESVYALNVAALVSGEPTK